jgi:exodeoxyribonuclease VII small subunit
MPRAKKSTKAPRFEEALERLETIASSLEECDLTLEQSLGLFEEGVRLTRLCAARLDQAQKRIEMLTRSEDGEMKTSPFDAPGDEGGTESDEETADD